MQERSPSWSEHPRAESPDSVVLYGPRFDEDVRRQARELFDAQPSPLTLGGDHVGLALFEAALAHRIDPKELRGQPAPIIHTIIDSALATHKPSEQWMCVGLEDPWDNTVWGIAQTEAAKKAIADRSEAPASPEQRALALALHVSLPPAFTRHRAAIRIEGHLYKHLVGFAVREVHVQENDVRAQYKTVAALMQYIEDERRETRNTVLSRIQLGTRLRIWMPTHSVRKKAYPGHMGIVTARAVVDSDKTYTILCGGDVDEGRHEANIGQILEVDPQ